MSFVKEFREFAMKGNVVDMAVGLVIGAGFGKIVSSLVNDIIMPPLGLVIGGVDFKGLVLTLKSAKEAIPAQTLSDGTVKAAQAAVAAVNLNYGMFIQQIFDFVIIAFAMFTVVKVMNRMKKQEAAAPPPAVPVATGEEVLLREIRDILKSK